MTDMNMDELKVAVRRALEKHDLGAARVILNPAGTELHVILQREREPLTMNRHLAITDIEQATGKTTQIQSFSSLSPAEQRRLEDLGFAV